MAGLTTLRECPSVINAGDTLLFRITDADFPASDWLLSYALRGGGSQIDFAATDDLNSHLINVSATTTRDWVSGTYTVTGKYTNRLDASKVTTKLRGTIQVVPDMSLLPADADTRSWAKRGLDDCKSALAKAAGGIVLNTTIAGQSIGRITVAELKEKYAFFDSLYQQELNQEAANQKKPQRSNIGISFVLPA